MSAEAGTRAFAPFEWMVALRYLRARRREGFISVIAGFSFLGIMLGVATLIIVMAEEELRARSLGTRSPFVSRLRLEEFMDKIVMMVWVWWQSGG